MELQHFCHDHKLIFDEENKLDLDDKGSSLCWACRLPIFSTPCYYCSAGCNFFLHKECAFLPEKMEHQLHPKHHLLLQTNTLPQSRQPISCSVCPSGYWGDENLFYGCYEQSCTSRVHVSCAFPLGIKLFHRSHPHELIPIRKSFLQYICGACGLKHGQQHQQQGPSYLCNLCGFLIHEECALLPNAIRHNEHSDHGLTLTYAFPQISPRVSRQCAFCKEKIQSLGVYFCGQCSYYAHIKCATSNHQLFKPMPGRDVKHRTLIHLPMADEHTSPVSYLLKNRTSMDETGREKLFKDKHDHPLTYHENDGGLPRLCSGCVQPISPPFYSCCQCKDFYLHHCCANLPSKLQHPVHEDHPLILFPKIDNEFFYIFRCDGCHRLCNGFAYTSKLCRFTLDVECALLPYFITHETHGRHHILFLYFSLLSLSKPFYECSICRDFKMDFRSVVLPRTVRHTFDKHSLKLITPTSSSSNRESSYRDAEHFCEICEQEMEKKQSYFYGCEECNQSFHIDCIPSVGVLSKINFGGAIRVQCHQCPMTCIRMLTVGSYRCGYCREIIKGFVDQMAFECSKCDFRIHYDCAKECWS